MMAQVTDIVELPNGKATYFQLIQWKAALRLEKVGMKHSSGKSARAHVARMLGVSIRTSYDELIGVLEGYINN